jgi:hypothetical protein
MVYSQESRNTMQTVKLDDIIISDHFRKDLGDIDGLAASIEAVGLLQPVAIRPGMHLVCGRRRIEAFRKLGRTEIAAHVVEGLDDELKVLLAECDENTCRKNFTPSEAVAIGKAMKELVRAQARERQAHAGPTTGKGRKRSASGKLPQALKGRTRDTIASYVGWSPRTYEKAEAVIDAAAADPELAQIVAEMDASGNVDRAYRQVQAKQSSGQTAKGKKPAKKPSAATTSAVLPNAPTVRPHASKIKRFLRSLSGAKTFSDFRAAVNCPSCMGLSTAGLDNITLYLRKMRPDLAPVVLSLVESLTGADSARVVELLRAVLLLSPASRPELLADLRREQDREKGR